MSKASRPEYGNEQVSALIKEFIHDKTDRRMLYLRLVDNDTIGEIAVKVKLDYTTVWRRLNKAENELFKHFPG